MEQFKPFAAAIAARFARLSNNELFTTDVDGDFLWAAYLGAFPEGTNPMYRVRTSHDGSYDRNFVRRLGNVVALVGGKLVTLWGDSDDLPYPYNVVCAHMDALVKNAQITGVFRTKELKFGYESTVERLDTGATHRWYHFHAPVAARHRVGSPAEAIGQTLTDFRVFARGISELKLDALDTVIDLIGDNALYRGAEFQSAVSEYRKLLLGARSAESAAGSTLNRYLWHEFTTRPRGVTLLRNTAIGTLLVDLSEGVELEAAVRSFESKVAPTNYRRPTALVTPKMVAQATATLDEHGLSPALQRRHATMADLTINNVLWVNNGAQARMKDGLAGLLAADLAKAPTKAKPATDISIEDFMANVLPKATDLEVLLATPLAANLVSLTTAEDPAAPHLFKWDNPFAWSYRGNMTDSIKERVKRAGGNVDAALRISLAWTNYDDLDLHAMTPHGHVYFGYKNRVLDVDMNVSTPVKDPVENLSWVNPPNGAYSVFVNQYRVRETSDVGFTLEVADANGTRQWTYDKAVRQSNNIQAFTFTMHNGVMTSFKVADPDLKEGSRSTTAWGLQTESYVKVNALMFSPNFWDDQAVGNKHWFFILDGCANDEPTRGIYNEFLRSDLDKHRKVFELVGERTKVPPAGEQLSGLGFSSTQRNTLRVLAKGPKLHAHYNINF